MSVFNYLFFRRSYIRENFAGRSLQGLVPFRKVVLYVCLISLMAISCKSKKKDAGGGKGGQRQPSALQVEGFRVEASTISDQIEVPGSLLPSEETQIKAEVSGRVVRLNIIEGGIVKRGALLAKLFDGDLQAQRNKLEVQLKIAQKTEERQKELLTINGISQQEYDLSTLSVDNLKADLQSTRIAIDKTEIRAPYDGQLGLRNISLGSFISPTDIITTIRQVNVLKLDFSIPEKYAGNIQKGHTINFTVEPGMKTHTAKVIATENSVDPTTRTLRVKALVNEKDPELVPGVFAKVNLELGKNNEALMVPTQAIIPQARNKQLILFKEDSATFIVVETGIRNASFIQVLAGVSPGDTILTTGLMSIRPDTKITLTKITTIPKRK